ncbi:hypothetical protein OG520_21260 [Streptomyces sp. NBC_00984]|uniref:hypothetical protein n=1 Tax=Streptomyces sp. NBC_00984 TaxID=2903700 RepID=UPI003866A678|nr:hypothetical protein OG520_21260 [Streptomyces sp. NBC_00984]
MLAENGRETEGCCPECQKLRLAEALANDQYDYSGATDCRVLLQRHRGTADCTERGSA